MFRTDRSRLRRSLVTACTQLLAAEFCFGPFVQPQVLHCKRNRELVLCSVSSDLFGGSRSWHGTLERQTLFVELVANASTYQAFWWHGVARRT